MSKAVNTANPKYSKLTIGVCLLCLRTSVTVLGLGAVTLPLGLRGEWTESSC